MPFFLFLVSQIAPVFFVKKAHKTPISFSKTAIKPTAAIAAMPASFGERAKAKNAFLANKRLLLI